jgi:hypothetical protein
VVWCPCPTLSPIGTATQGQGLPLSLPRPFVMANKVEWRWSQEIRDSAWTSGCFDGTLGNPYLPFCAPASLAGRLGLLLPQRAMGPSQLLQFLVDPGGFSSGSLFVRSALAPTGHQEGAGKTSTPSLAYWSWIKDASRPQGVAARRDHGGGSSPTPSTPAWEPTPSSFSSLSQA